MKRPKLSPRFDINDIHKLREYDSERSKKMTTEEFLAEIKESAAEGERKIEEYRKGKKVAER